MNAVITTIITGVMNFATDFLMPMMVMLFFGAVTLRFLIWATLKRESWFSRAFEKRAQEYLFKTRQKNMKPKYSSFYITTKMLLEKTYYELFVMRAIMKRRNPDIIMDKWDRILLVQPGCARIVKDTLSQAQLFRYDQGRPDMTNTASVVFEKNPHFNAVFGYLPVGTFNDVLNILPGIFIVFGIFGTFLGIMAALPELGAMDLADIDKTKTVMDTFLVKMAYSMSTSILGIIFNVSLTILNSFLNPSKIFIDSVERFSLSLEKLWNACQDNSLPIEIRDFDEHKDPIEALAEESVEKEHRRSRFYQSEQPDNEDDRIREIVKTASERDRRAA